MRRNETVLFVIGGWGVSRHFVADGAACVHQVWNESREGWQLYDADIEAGKESNAMVRQESPKRKGEKRMNPVISELCDLILMLKEAGVRGGVLMISATYEDGLAKMMCVLTMEAMSKIDKCIGSQYDEYWESPNAKMLCVGNVCFTANVAADYKKKMRGII